MIISLMGFIVPKNSFKIGPMKADWRIPYLPKNREILVVPATDRFMREAAMVRDAKSTDRNHPNGAVVVKDGKILGDGANRCQLKRQGLIDLHEKGWCLRSIFKVKTGTKYWLCPGCSSYSNHAESRAVRNAQSKSGYEATKGADIYIYGHYWCCKPCWDSMLVAGIRNVYVVEGAYELFKKK